jgi:hypothetical protein
VGQRALFPSPKRRSGGCVKARRKSGTFSRHSFAVQPEGVSLKLNIGIDDSGIVRTPSATSKQSLYRRPDKGQRYRIQQGLPH